MIVKRQKEYGLFGGSDKYIQGRNNTYARLEKEPEKSLGALEREININKRQILGTYLDQSQASQAKRDSLRGANSVLNSKLYDKEKELGLAPDYSKEEEKEYSAKSILKTLPLLALLSGPIASGQVVAPGDMSRQRDSLVNLQIKNGAAHAEKILNMFKDENPATAIFKIPKLTKEYKSDPKNVKIQEELAEAIQHSSKEMDPTLKADYDWINDSKNYKMSMTKDPEFAAIKERASKRFPKK